MTTPTPAPRNGWSRTLIKCGIALVATVALGTAAMFALLKKLLDWLPDWLPTAWGRWLVEWMLSHVWFVGPLVGALAGLVLSVGIVVFDAKRGRLTRLP